MLIHVRTDFRAAELQFEMEIGSSSRQAFASFAIENDVRGDGMLYGWLVDTSAQDNRVVKVVKGVRA